MNMLGHRDWIFFILTRSPCYYEMVVGEHLLSL